MGVMQHQPVWRQSELRFLEWIFQVDIAALMASNFGVESEACLVLGLIATILISTGAVSRVGSSPTIWLMLHGELVQ